MSDMLNEKFEEFVTESHKELAETLGQEPMGSIAATIIPGGDSYHATGQTKGAVNAVGGTPEGRTGHAADLSTDVATGGQSITDNGGPVPTGNEEGEDNPGAKASAPIGAVSGDPQQRGTGKDEPAGSEPKFNHSITHGTTTGPDVAYPIKPSFEEVDMSSDVDALTEGTELTEEFKNKAKTIFEAAVKSKLNEEWTKLEEQFKTQLEAKTVEIRSELAEEVNGTCKYAVQNWLEENQIAIDRGIRNEITEDFIAGLKNLFNEHYINIPDEKIEVVEGLTEDLRKMEERLNEQIERNVGLNNRLDESARTVVLNTISEGLADTQKDKLAKLAEGVGFESEEKFAEAVKTLRESYFPDAPAVKAVEATDETPVEGQGDVGPAMASYMQAIERWQ
jgi:hypothetical protein